MRLVFDLETTGLLWQADRIWIICTHDLDTKEERFYSDVDPEAYGSIEEGIDYLYSADVLVAHNGIGYDKLIIQKLYNRKYTGVFRDTMIMSQVLNFKRFNGRHGLAVWGEFFGVPKPVHEDWSQYSQEMKHRCQEDVKINVLTLDYLVNELRKRKDPEKLKLGLESEHYVAEFCAQAELHGWPFDKEKAIGILQQLEEKIQEAKDFIEPQLKLKVKAYDASGEVRAPRFNKNGQYAAASVNWLGINPAEGLLEEHKRTFWGPCTRVEVIQPDIGSLESVKELLYEHGWKPDEWNWKRNAKGVLIKTTPKLTDSSLEPLGKLGEVLSEFYALRARHSILSGWVEALDENNRLHGSCFVIGTPTFRSRHSIIANIPSMNATFGPEIRSCFTCEPGYKIIGADSSGNQLRGLCHYVNDDDFTKEVTEGDIHTFNGTIIEAVYGSLGGKARAIAKTFLYAFLYAGGDGKLGLIVSGKRDADLGKKLRQEFMRRIPGLGLITRKAEKQWEVTHGKTGKGYIMGLDGRLVYAESKRLALNYLLQSCEKITVSLSIMWGMQKMQEEGIWYQPLICYHDEVQLVVKEEDSERAAQIWKEAFAEGPKLLGVNCMAGESKVGGSWFETH